MGNDAKSWQGRQNQGHRASHPTCQGRNNGSQAKCAATPSSRNVPAYGPLGGCGSAFCCASGSHSSVRGSSRRIVQGEIAEPTRPKAAYIFRTLSRGFDSDEDVAQLKVVKSRGDDHLPWIPQRLTAAHMILF
jgi:hypothetical protein